MFDGSLCNYTGSEYKIELLEGAKPNYTKHFPIPKIHKESLKIEVNWLINICGLKYKNEFIEGAKPHKETLKTEVDRLVNIGVLKRKNNSKWATPTFMISKNNGIVCFISDFREVNKRIRGNLFQFLNN